MVVNHLITILIEELAWRWLFFHLLPYNELTRLLSAFCFGYLHIFNVDSYRENDSPIFRFIMGPCYVLISMQFGYLITEHRHSILKGWLIHGLNNLIASTLCVVLTFQFDGIPPTALAKGVYQLVKESISPPIKPPIVHETEPYNE